MSCIGILNPNAAALALAPFTRNLGSAAAMAGFTQITLASVVSAVVGASGAVSLLSFAVLMSASSVCALLVLLTGRRYIRNLVTGESAVPAAH